MRIELVAMNDEESFSVGSDVDEFVGDFDGAEDEFCGDMFEQVTHEFVVITGGVENLRSTVAQIREASKDAVIDFRPTPAGGQFAAIDGITDKINGFRFKMIKQGQKSVGPAVR